MHIAHKNKKAFDYHLGLTMFIQKLTFNYLCWLRLFSDLVVRRFSSFQLQYQ